MFCLIVPFKLMRSLQILHQCLRGHCRFRVVNDYEDTMSAESTTTLTPSLHSHHVRVVNDYVDSCIREYLLGSETFLKTVLSCLYRAHICTLLYRRVCYTIIRKWSKISSCSGSIHRVHRSNYLTV